MDDKDPRTIGPKGRQPKYESAKIQHGWLVGKDLGERGGMVKEEGRLEWGNV